ncbi:class I SAM-dependent methyltransferase [Alkaliphilus hydrothermalis]|uniref:SAM-dependent methyltransferase n=1 Tax=Alkaliphilus hydrothermalis TaxID=1482730 RepID=A0ABS2NNH0_9FIRM|nr:methyltransferase domain-containing protein [Alkaliphilus hydrothermalis]MBM7614491.1 SAM-dependent methyltransferase [Alkaliphilus hydrothermalis]
MTKPVYDKHYKKQNYFGEPYPGLVKFFKEYEPKCNVLDLGCGQGRDALFLGRLGYKVKGIDISSVGLDQMNQIANDDNLDVIGEVGDVYTYPVSTEYDLILLDSMLHFYKGDLEEETNFIKRIALELKVEGVLANFMIKGAKREKHLKSVLNGIGIDWEVLCDDYTEYPESNAQFHMYIIKKITVSNL